MQLAKAEFVPNGFNDLKVVFLTDACRRRLSIATLRSSRANGACVRGSVHFATFEVLRFVNDAV
jgi:hypothetical protein